MTSSPRPSKKGAVLVFGESVNDSQSIMHLLIGANASLDGRVRSLRRPVSLTRNAKLNAVRDWVDELRRTVQAFEANNGRAAAVIVHRDADGHDPDGAVTADLARQLTTLDGHPVVPVQAIEAWWFLFPEAVEAVRPRTWKDSLPRQPRDVENIGDFAGLGVLEEIAGHRFRRGVVLYTGTDVVSFGPKLVAAPVSLLWS